MKRCFVAILPDVATLMSLAEAVRGVELPNLKPTVVPNMHVTVRFLGDVEEDKVPSVIEAMREAAAAHAPFDLVSQGLAVFPKIERPRVLAAVFEGGRAATAVHGDIEAATVACGFEPEDRDYTPHVTLGRFRPPRGGRVPPFTLAGLALPDMRFAVDRLLFMESVLKQPAPEYTVLAELPLSRS